MEILVVWEILAKISGRSKWPPLGVYVDQKSLVFPGLINSYFYKFLTVSKLIFVRFKRRFNVIKRSIGIEMGKFCQRYRYFDTEVIKYRRYPI